MNFVPLNKSSLLQEILPDAAHPYTPTPKPTCPGETFNVIYMFTGTGDRRGLQWSLTVDSHGNLYGTTPLGGSLQNCFGDTCGVVFKLSLKGSHWVYSPLYEFENQDDGGQATGPVTLDRLGQVYGPGSIYGGDGLVFDSAPGASRPISVITPWKQTVLHAFPDPNDANPFGRLVFDAAGNLYGANYGNYTPGTIFKLTPNGKCRMKAFCMHFREGWMAQVRSTV